MKKSFIILATAMFIAGTSLTSCKSNSEKEAESMGQKDYVNGVSELPEDEASATKANDAEWQTFKKNAGMTIDANQTQIEALTTAMNKAGNSFDANYKASINSLQEKNESLKSKIADYENNQTDWDSFEREFNSDMTELGQAFKDLTVNNKR